MPPEDGTAALPAVGTTQRKAFLASLVAELSLDEIWMLREKLAAMDLRTDIVARLPGELQIMVADQLGPADLGCCLDVSREWRQTLLLESMRRNQARRCFPGLLEYVEAVKATKDDQDEALSSRLFYSVARKYAVRARGQIHTVLRHLPCPKATVLADQVEADRQQRPWMWPREESKDIKNRMPMTREDVFALLVHNRPEGATERPTTDEVESLLQRYTAETTLVVRDGLGVRDAPRRGDDRFVGPDFAYGRLFWQLYRKSKTHILVDDLHNGRRYHFTVRDDIPRGEMFMLTAFGDELVVVAFTGTRLLTWNFVTGEQQTKQLSAQIDVAATLGQRVWVLSNGSLFVWEMGSMLLEVSLTGMDAQHQLPDLDGRLPSFFMLDPVQPDVFFRGNFEIEMVETTQVAETADGLGTDHRQAGSGMMCVHVHEFCDRQFRQTYTYRLGFSNFAFPTALIETTMRRDSRGTYTLASWRVSDSEDGARPGPVALWTALRLQGIGSLSFNVYTRSFTRSFFRLPPLAPSISHERPTPLRVHVWNDTLLTLVDRHSEPGGGADKMRRAPPMLLAFEDALGEGGTYTPAAPFSTVPLYGDTTGSKRWAIDDADWAATGCLVRYILDLDAQSPWSSRPAHIGDYHLMGDDDFIVVEHNGEHTVWQFRAGGACDCQ